MTECQGCGAWNDARRALCVLCGVPLAETDEWEAAAEPPPLPPLPDGGLRDSMPAWLRESPAPPVLPVPIPPARHAPPPGPRADPRTFLTDDDFPRWLRDLAARRMAPEDDPPRAAKPLSEGEQPPAALPVPATPPVTADPEPERSIAAAILGDPAGPIAAGAAMGAPPTPVPGSGAATQAASVRPRQDRRREPWETLLLAALVIGVAAAALWALAANGAFGPGP